jgi:uncharacterized protein (DUF2141 family)
MHSTRFIIVSIVFLSLSFSRPLPTSPLVVELKNVRFNLGGTLYIMVVDENEKPLYQLKRSLKETNPIFTFDKLSQGGEYAIKVYHDQNNNGQLDKGIFGQPVEGWGVSNDARGFMSAPPFKKMLVKLDQPKRININLSY